MKANRFLNWIYFVVLSLSFTVACVSAPVDTYNKRAAVFELGYIEILKTAKLYLASPNTPTAIKRDIKKAVETAATAREAMQFAEGAGDITTAQGQLQTAQSALGLLRKLVAEKENIP